MSRRRLARKSFAADRRGGVGILAAAGGALLCVLAALAVDLGSVALHARKVQGAADLAALSAASDLPAAQRAADATVQANLGPGAQIRVTIGTYSPNAAVDAAERFAPATVGEPPDAARVEVVHPARLLFGRALLGRDAVNVRRSATAALEPHGEPLAAFSIGSRLARLDGGVANALLGALAGGSVSLSVMDYDALLDADVDLLTWLDALALDLGVRAADYDSLLATEVEAGQALSVLSRLLDGRASDAVDEIAEASDGSTFTIGDLAGVSGGIGRNIQATVSVLDLTTAMLEVAGGGRQVKLDLGADAVLADLDVWLAIGERPNQSPWMTVTGTASPIIRTAQTRLHIQAKTNDGLAGLASVRVPVVIEIAASEARLQALDCDPDRQVTVDVRPGLARAWIGSVDASRLNDFTVPLRPQPATLVSLLGLTVTGFADVEAASGAWTSVQFSSLDIAEGGVKRVATSGATQAVMGSLLERLDLNVIGLDLGGVARALGGLLAPVGPALDAVIEPLLALLGVRLGEADIRVHGLSCPAAGGGTPVLVA